MFDSSRLKRAETIFQAVVELPASRRAPALAKQCAGDAELRAFVERLLNHDDSGMQGFLAAPPADAAGRLSPAPSFEVPKQIGDFQIRGRIGEGGMGVVYEAQQARPARPVALKVIRGGRYVDDNTVRLFQRETQALARLRHPCIGAIYEAGRTDDGQHYFAMELVRGRPLLEYVRDRSMALRDRLELFRRICDAIHYAHQRGVMHRDLKPGNILIDDEGAPRVLDFGLARITEADVAITTHVTLPGRIQGTLSYMSPEQARGNPDEIDIRSDVYSLGVILYELLTGRLPYELAGKALPEAVRMICEQPPQSISALARVDPRLAVLTGDPETIMLKALEKEPQRRYSSAAMLAEDIRRFLDSQPILARPPSTMYQLRKLVARRKAACAFAGVLLGTIIGFGVWMSVLYGHQRRERVRAENAAAEAEAMVELLKDMLGAADPDTLHGEDYTVRELLDHFAALGLPELRDQPAVEATLRLTMGNAYLGLGRFAKAAEHIRKALELRRAEFGDEDARVAEAIHALAGVEIFLGDYAAADVHAREALALRRRLPGDLQLDVSETLLLVGRIQETRGEYDAAESAYQEALGIRRGRLGNAHPDTADVLHRLGTTEQHRGNAAAAEPYYQEALGIRQASLGAAHPSVASVQFDYASLLQARGELDAAEARYRDALAVAERAYGPDHPHVGWVCTGLGTLLRSRGRLAEAEALFRRALAVMGARLKPDHPALGTVRNNLALVLRGQNKLEEAESMLREALESFRQQEGGKGLNSASCLTNLAAICAATGRLDEAESQFADALEIYRTIWGDRPQLRVAVALGGYAGLAHRRGDLATAESRYREALRIFDEATSADHPQAATAMLGLARVLLADGRAGEADPVARRALDIRSRLLDAGDPGIAEAQALIDEIEARSRP